ncbi:MAG: bifunctional DNA-formamidopyrimidine glycosylase/DNA-(apurinic or apyrimidinic site) lyase [Candidatus Levybacteria bacterium]|nr:bifunctional DNA-formamidopyrimidine glycosylase/DNA-(apurinic or apyrimidinic site) lyase [Candidatus Levybacteria bacterium]
MPELPEVESIRLGLEKYLIGKKIIETKVFLSKIIQGDLQEVMNTDVIGIRRFGKGLVVDFENNYSLAFHVKMTGQIIYRDAAVEKTHLLSSKVTGQILPGNGTHIIFILNENAQLFYNDLRQFGWIKAIKTDELKKIKFFKELGPELQVGQKYDNQGILKLDGFCEIIKKSKVAIKSLILDQKKIGGIGNIYANDALWEARINPRKKAQELNDYEIKNLYNSLLKVLKDGLDYGGASEMSFVNALGQEGSYQDHFRVYAQNGKQCKRCNMKIVKEFIGGRGSFYCPKCQY